MLRASHHYDPAWSMWSGTTKSRRSRGDYWCHELGEVSCIFFDKTGTLTKIIMCVEEICVGSEPSLGADGLLLARRCFPRPFGVRAGLFPSQVPRCPRALEALSWAYQGSFSSLAFLSCRSRPCGRFHAPLAPGLGGALSTLRLFAPSLLLHRSPSCERRSALLRSSGPFGAFIREARFGA